MRTLFALPLLALLLFASPGLAQDALSDHEAH